MPCRDPDEGQIADAYKRRLDELTAMVCEMFTEMEEDYEPEDMAAVLGSRLFHWWEEHKQSDAERRERERLEGIERGKRTKARLAALAKLTPAERKALGL